MIDPLEKMGQGHFEFRKVRCLREQEQKADRGSCWKAERWKIHAV